ncbi:hypothetical protein RP20_CCG025581 [Aedes albopictus]|nr:hypothetical protein RP20_CCG025581 [Aedes albopictus]
MDHSESIAVEPEYDTCCGTVSVASDLVRGISMKATGLEEMAPPASSRKLFTDRADRNSSTTSGITLTEAAYVNVEVASHLGSFVHLPDGNRGYRRVTLPSALRMLCAWFCGQST